MTDQTRRIGPPAAGREPGPNRRGNAILEMALVLPLMLYFAMGLVEFGQFCALKSAFEAAARDAARLGSRTVAVAADPATAATATLAASNVTFSASWLTIYDESNTTVVTDVSTVPAGHVLKFCLATTVAQVPGGHPPPLHSLTGQGIGDGKVLWGECAMVKE